MVDYSLRADQRAAVARWRRRGFTADQTARLAITSGWQPVAVIKVLKEAFGLTIGQGKVLVDGLRDTDARIADEYLRLQAELAARFPPDASEADVDRMEIETGWTKKLWALVAAGRAEDAASALDRFDPESMTFQPLALHEASSMVQSEISPWPISMVILEDQTSEYEFGWTFSCQSAAYAQSGDMLDMAVGHGPFLVDKYTGALWATGSASPKTVLVANYRSSGNPSIDQRDRSADR